MNIKPIIFLDIDGVLNCQVYYESQDFTDYKQAKKQLRKDVKSERIDRLKYYSSQICSKRVSWMNDLCSKINADVVISSTWRKGKSITELQEILTYCGASFKVIDKTPCTGYERGTEIAKWLRDNITIETHGQYYFDFKKYAIIDDDSDMLLSQQFNFFKTDEYSGLTPSTCYKIEKFINSVK